METVKNPREADSKRSRNTMKDSPRQLDMRENTASSRRHASRLKVSASPETVCETRARHSPLAIDHSMFSASLTPAVDSEPAIDARTDEILYLGPEKRGEYEFLNCKQLADRWNVPETWIRERVRRRTQDPLPHVRFGKYVRFRWGAPELEDWAERRIVTGSNRKTVRTLVKEKDQ